MSARSLLSRALNALNVTDLRERRACAARLGHYRRNPGDLRGEEELIGFALAGLYVAKGPGWIPVYQAEGMRLAAIAARIMTDADLEQRGLLRPAELKTEKANV